MVNLNHIFHLALHQSTVSRHGSRQLQRLKLRSLATALLQQERRAMFLPCGPTRRVSSRHFFFPFFSFLILTLLAGMRLRLRIIISIINIVKLRGQCLLQSGCGSLISAIHSVEYVSPNLLLHMQLVVPQYKAVQRIGAQKQCSFST